MANKRVFYAIHQVGLRPLGSVGSFDALHGVQSVAVTTTFNLTQVFEWGQLAVYENIEGVPDVEVTAEKLIDGYEPIYTKATQGSTSASLVGRSTARTSMAISIFKDTDESCSGTPTSEVEMSGLYISEVGYSATADGNVTENVTFVGNDKVWVTDSNFSFNGAFSGNDDEPLALTASGSGGVQQREDVLFTYTTAVPTPRDANGTVSGIGTVLPQDIYGVSGSGTNDKTSGEYGVHVTGFSANASLGREAIFELGRKAPYFRYVQFPVEVTTEITVISVSGDFVNAREEAQNLSDRTIRLHMREGLVLNMGKKNKLQTVGSSGGDTDGGNEELTYTYVNQNDLEVYHPQDSTSALWGPPYKTGSGAKV